MSLSCQRKNEDMNTIVRAIEINSDAIITKFWLYNDIVIHLKDGNYEIDETTIHSNTKPTELTEIMSLIKSEIPKHELHVRFYTTTNTLNDFYPDFWPSYSPMYSHEYSESKTYHGEYKTPISIMAIGVLLFAISIFNSIVQRNKKSTRLPEL